MVQFPEKPDTGTKRMAQSLKRPDTGNTAPDLKNLALSKLKASVDKFRYDELVAHNQSISEAFPEGEPYTKYGVHVAGLSKTFLGTLTPTNVGGYLGFPYTDDATSWMLQGAAVFDTFSALEVSVHEMIVHGAMLLPELYDQNIIGNICHTQLSHRAIDHTAY